LYNDLVRWVGALLIAVGGWCTLHYFNDFDTSVEIPRQEIDGQWFGGGRVNNLGLMADRQNGIIFGLGAVLIGILLIGFSRHQNTLVGSDLKKCPFCGESIRGDAILCRFCGSSTPDTRPQKRQESWEKFASGAGTSGWSCQCGYCWSNEIDFCPQCGRTRGSIT